MKMNLFSFSSLALFGLLSACTDGFQAVAPTNGSDLSVAPATDRMVPRIATDDDGWKSTSYVRVNRTGWDAKTCGLSGALSARIADCAIKFGEEATWDGTQKGHYNETVWKLVTRTGNIVPPEPLSGASAEVAGRGREVWQDQKTGLLWSSLLSSRLGWCKATGNNVIPGHPAGDAPIFYSCERPQNQSQTRPAVSACLEDGTNNFTDIDPDIDPTGKAGLGLSSSPSVMWNLPTMSHYRQAEVDGLRFVLPDAGPVGYDYEMISNTDFNLTWLFVYTGEIQNSGGGRYGVRCVGGIGVLPTSLVSTSTAEPTVSKTTATTPAAPAVVKTSSVACGLSGSIARRISDCELKNGASATWDGTSVNKAIWKLVTQTGPMSDQCCMRKAREVWQDQKTGLLWSSLISLDINWCKAAGSNNIPGNPYAEKDLNKICTDRSNQNTSGKAISACYEDGENKFTSVDPAIDIAGKAGLGFSSTPSVAWRIPMISDYHQAVINGIDEVLPDMIGYLGEWSGTSSSRLTAKYSWYDKYDGPRTEVLFYNQPDGRVLTRYRFSTLAVRCVGR
jgi:hypothetical protein